MGIRLRPHDRHCRQTLEDAVEVRPPPDINGQQSSVIGPVATRVGALCVLMRGLSLGTLSGST